VTKEILENKVFKEKPEQLEPKEILVRPEPRATRETLELKGSKVRPVPLVLLENRVSKV
tara:strand:- start:558 stop:734 length:177 start_codon:yes stop_codon:yes gene_type:complete